MVVGVERCTRVVRSRSSAALIWRRALICYATAAASACAAVVFIVRKVDEA